MHILIDIGWCFWGSIVRELEKFGKSENKSCYLLHHSAVSEFGEIEEIILFPGLSFCVYALIILKIQNPLIRVELHISLLE